jgi:DNA polymerase III delta prime subunit
MVDDRQIPHFLLYGPPGTGKTTTILAMAHRLFGPKDYRSYVVEVGFLKTVFAAQSVFQFNASDDRGIDVVRNNIIKFAESTAIDFDTQRAADSNVFKLIILDEADAMTKDAQNALKRKSSGN